MNWLASITWLLIAVLVTSNVAAAEGIDDTPQIQVRGEAERFVTPSGVTISLGVTTNGADHISAMANNSATIQNVLNAAKARGVDDKDLRTARVTLTDINRGKAARGQKRPFRAENIVYVTVRDLSLVETLLGDLITAGANRIQGISPVLKANPGLDQRLRRDAVTHARSIAEDLAAAAGVRLGKILRMSVLSSSPQPMGGLVQMRSSHSSVPSVPIEAGQVRVSKQVNIVWEIKQ